MREAHVSGVRADLPQPINTAPKAGRFLGWDAHGPEVWDAEAYWNAMAEGAAPHLPRNEARALTHWSTLPPGPSSVPGTFNDQGDKA